MKLPVIDLPIYKTTLPSTGKVVKYTPFTTKEEKLLLTSKESGDVGEMLEATKRIITKSFFEVDVDSLTPFDIDYLYIQLIIASVSNVSKLRFKNSSCPKNNGQECDKDVNITLDLSQITVQQYDEKSESFSQYTANGNQDVLIRITDTIAITVKYPGFNETLKYAQLENPTEDDLIKLCITSVIDGDAVITKEEFEYEDIEEFYLSIPPIKIDELKAFMRNIPQVRYETNFICRECGFTEPLVLESFEDFFG